MGRIFTDGSKQEEEVVAALFPVDGQGRALATDLLRRLPLWATIIFQVETVIQRIVAFLEWCQGHLREGCEIIASDSRTVLSTVLRKCKFSNPIITQRWCS